MDLLLSIILFAGTIAFCFGPGIALILAVEARKNRRYRTARHCAAVSLYGAAVGFPGGVLCWMGTHINDEFAALGWMVVVPIVGIPQGIVSLSAWLILRREDRRRREEEDQKEAGTAR